MIFWINFFDFFDKFIELLINFVYKGFFVLKLKYYWIFYGSYSFLNLLAILKIEDLRLAFD